MARTKNHSQCVKRTKSLLWPQSQQKRFQVKSKGRRNIFEINKTIRAIRINSFAIVCPWRCREITWKGQLIARYYTVCGQMRMLQAGDFDREEERKGKSQGHVFRNPQDHNSGLMAVIKPRRRTVNPSELQNGHRRQQQGPCKEKTTTAKGRRRRSSSGKEKRTESRVYSEESVSVVSLWSCKIRGGSPKIRSLWFWKVGTVAKVYLATSLLPATAIKGKKTYLGRLSELFLFVATQTHSRLGHRVPRSYG